MSDKHPLISVIVPTFKRAQLLRRSVRSVLAQTYRNLELLVIDDCSPDETPQVMAEFDDPRVRYIRLERNQRAARARNIGIEAARGELIAFQDDDDVWLINKLARQVECLQNAPADVGLCIAGYLRCFADRADYIGGHDRFGRMDFRQGPLRGFALIATPGWLVRRDCLARSGGFDPAMRSWDDWELAYRLSKVCRFCHVDEPLYIQDRATGGAMWSNRAVYASDMRVILDKHGQDWHASPETLAYFYRLAGRYEAQYGETAEARTLLRRSLALRPWQPQVAAMYALTAFGQRPFGDAAAMVQRLRRGLGQGG